MGGITLGFIKLPLNHLLHKSIHHFLDYNELMFIDIRKCYNNAISIHGVNILILACYNNNSVV